VKRTPFYEFHQEHDARMVEFAGWEMPILYRSILEEHQQVREHAGIFDVSHMGRIHFTGRHARRFLERVLTRRISDQKEKTCRYSLICNETGGVKDDVLIYRYDQSWMMVCNAANRAKLLDHFEAVKGDLSVKIDDQTEQTAMVAIQGPKTMDFVSSFSKEIPTLKKYHFTVKNLLILKMTVSRTGYTGEDGIELILPAKAVGMALKMLMKPGADGELPIKPCGLGARDTLRLEAGMPLYGHELTEQIDPLAAGLDFAVSLDKDRDEQWGEPEPFIGLEALQEIMARGSARKLVGLKLDGRRSPRQEMTVLADGDEVGHVTSGCLSPTLGHPIAMAYVDAERARVGGTLQIDFGRKQLDAEVMTLPFYRRGT